MAGYCTLVLYFDLPAARENTAAHSCNIQPYCLLTHQIIYIYFKILFFCSTVELCRELKVTINWFETCEKHTRAICLRKQLQLTQYTINTYSGCCTNVRPQTHWQCSRPCRVLKADRLSLCQIYMYTAVCVDLARCEPKSCAHEYNYVVKFFYRLNRKPNHIITFTCTAFWFTFCKQQ